MKVRDVKWDHEAYSAHQWRHAYFVDRRNIASGAVAWASAGPSFYRLHAGSHKQYDMGPLEFACWLEDKHQVPAP